MSSRLTRVHLKVLTAIERCRTAALGGHRDRCGRCGYETPSYSFNSCRNRHCGKCQTNARNNWLEARSRELLPVPYVHVVFTLPHQLADLVFHNQRILYDLLFRASAATLLEVAADPKHLGAEIGFAILAYGSFGLGAAVLSGALAAPMEAVYEWFNYWTDWDMGYKLAYLVILTAAGALIAGVGGWLLTTGLAKAGALGSLPPGQEVREARAV